MPSYMAKQCSQKRVSKEAPCSAVCRFLNIDRGKALHRVEKGFIRTKRQASRKDEDLWPGLEITANMTATASDFREEHSLLSEKGKAESGRMRRGGGVVRLASVACMP